MAAPYPRLLHDLERARLRQREARLRLSGRPRGDRPADRRRRGRLVPAVLRRVQGRG